MKNKTKKILNRFKLRRMKEGYWVDISKDEKNVIGYPLVDLVEMGEIKIYIDEWKEWLHLTLVFDKDITKLAKNEK